MNYLFLFFRRFVVELCVLILFWLWVVCLNRSQKSLDCQSLGREREMEKRRFISHWNFGIDDAIRSNPFIYIWTQIISEHLFHATNITHLDSDIQTIQTDIWPTVLKTEKIIERKTTKPVILFMYDVLTKRNRFILASAEMVKATPHPYCRDIKVNWMWMSHTRTPCANEEQSSDFRFESERANESAWITCRHVITTVACATHSMCVQVLTEVCVIHVNLPSLL